MIDTAFDAALDEYHDRERDAAARRAVEADRKAVRPDAVPQEVTFGELVENDFMTADGVRWVKVVRVEQRRKLSEEITPGWVTITFQTPEPLGVAYEDKWVIEREQAAPVTIDAAVRG